LNLLSDLECPAVTSGFGHLQTLRDYLEVAVEGSRAVFHAKREPDVSVLSESDIEALDYAVRHYGHMSTMALINAGHRQRAWKKSESHWIDYRLFFDEDNPHQKALLDLMEEDRENASFLAELAR
jgi:hypothetical protein